MWAAKNPHFNKLKGVNMKDQAAFPFVAKDKTGMMINTGMSLRDYFAAKAMQGCISGTPHSVDIEPTELATWCYIMADRMLKARGE
jgi:hypothetical protein